MKKATRSKTSRSRREEKGNEVVARFDDFWSHVSRAEYSIRDWHHPPLQRGEAAYHWDEKFAAAYDAIAPLLEPLAQKRMFVTPPSVPELSPFSAETAHQALMFVLNPAETTFGFPAALESPEYRQIKQEAQAEILQAQRDVGVVIEKPVIPSASRAEDISEESDSLLPRWDGERRELWYGQGLCKKYRQQAKHQTAILEEFEKEGWRERIIDPLGSGPENATRQRTADAIRALNDNDYLLFELAGDRKGILWKPR
jgi:hypothetical protein